MPMVNHAQHTLLIALMLSPPIHAAVQISEQYDPNSEQRMCSAVDEPLEPLCSEPSDEGDAPFFSPPILPDSIQLDLRPESCQSFFDDYRHTRRGFRIESALGIAPHLSGYQSTVSTYPVVDFISQGNIRVVKTRDLTANTFNNGPNNESLYKQIIQDAENVQINYLDLLAKEGVINATVEGHTTSITIDDVHNVSLDVVIQSGMATPTQINQIQRAKAEIENRWGFKLLVVEIP